MYATMFAFIVGFHAHRSGGRQCSFVFTTTASRARQQLSPNSGKHLTIDILDTWQKHSAHSTSVSCELLRVELIRLAKHYGPEQETKQAAQLHKALEYLEAESLWDEFLSAVTWNFEQSDELQLREEIIHRLEVDERTTALAAPILFDRLLVEVLTASARRSLQERTLTRDRFLEIASTTREELSHWAARSATNLSLFWHREVNTKLTELDQSVAELRDQFDRLQTPVRVPHEVPPPPPDFIPDQHFEDLSAAVEAGARTCTLSGMPGVGKTTLSCAIASRFSARFPDGQIFVSIAGSTPSPATRLQVAWHLCTALGIATVATWPESQFLNQARSALHGRRILLVFDDTSDTSQIEPFLGQSENLSIITSRNRLYIANAKATALAGWDAATAEAYLEEFAPQTIAQHVSRVFGGLPLALKLAKTTLAQRRDLPPAKYLEIIQSRPLPALASWSGDPSLGNCFDVIFNSLDATRLHLLALASAFVGPVSIDELQWFDILCFRSENPKPIDLPLSDLVKGNLLSYDEKAASYRVHAVIREAIQDSLRPDQLRELEQSHFIFIDDALLRLVTNGRGDPLTSIVRLYPEYAAAIGRLSSNASDEGARWGLYTLALHETTMWALPAALRVEILTSALEVARSYGDLEAQGDLLANLSVAHYPAGSGRLGVRARVKQYRIEVLRGDWRKQVGALAEIGMQLGDLGHVCLSEKYLQRALLLARADGDVDTEMRVLNNLGRLATPTQPTLALEYHRQALQVAEAVCDLRSQSKALMGIADCALTLRQDSSAASASTEALKRALASRLPFLIRDIALACSGVRSVLGDIDGALRAVQLAETHDLSNSLEDRSASSVDRT
ncbi:MAG: NB-ARC domain-containing protein [Polyangiaceae bacterium]